MLDVEIARAVDLKYQGQSFELTVPLPPAWSDDDASRHLAAAFGREHERTYGHKAEGDPIQMVNLRLTARVRRRRAAARIRLADARARAARRSVRPISARRTDCSPRP